MEKRRGDQRKEKREEKRKTREKGSEIKNSEREKTIYKRKKYIESKSSYFLTSKKIDL